MIPVVFIICDCILQLVLVYESKFRTLITTVKRMTQKGHCDLLVSTGCLLTTPITLIQKTSRNQENLQNGTERRPQWHSNDRDYYSLTGVSPR